MKKIIQILKDNPAYLALMKGKGEIVVSHASDEAILIASAFFSSERPMLIVKESLYQAQLLYQELYPILKKLEKAGYMTTYSQAYQGRKRKYYSITQEGKNHLQFLNEEWLTYKETLDGIVEGRLRHDKD